ncbi:unnamed protein product [Cylicostephanus goldi]|uniref:Uncharacterized protein n=1 Tax=Cylicostephanus goldi TaxID=71465 RepID=A0A3P6R3U1_CYLGO|nr:unnamed protein product [Cylicostephanus goldi]
MANFKEIPEEKMKVATSYYTSLLYTLGILASRLQGFRFELQCKFPYSMSDPVKGLLDVVYLVVDQLVADCLFAAEPSTSAILVTNNLFPFNCDSLARAVNFKHFDVQIVSEETAQAVQVRTVEIEVVEICEVSKCPRESGENPENSAQISPSEQSCRRGSFLRSYDALSQRKCLETCKNDVWLSLQCTLRAFIFSCPLFSSSDINRFLYGCD